jgi:hypothetical protein
MQVTSGCHNCNEHNPNMIITCNAIQLKCTRTQTRLRRVHYFTSGRVQSHKHHAGLQCNAALRPEDVQCSTCLTTSIYSGFFSCTYDPQRNRQLGTHTHVMATHHRCAQQRLFNPGHMSSFELWYSHEAHLSQQGSVDTSTPLLLSHTLLTTHSCLQGDKACQRPAAA